LILSGIIFPKLFINDAAELSREKIICAKKEANHLLNPLEGLLITEEKASEQQKNSNITYVALYTFFGIRYATVEIRNIAYAGKVPEYCDFQGAVILRKFHQ
jgi:hypothetical protein